MFLKKKSLISEKNNVQFINGFVSLGKIKLNVHCFKVDGVLIDTGPKVLLNEFKPFFANEDIDQAVITHFHEDHTGGANYLQEKYDLPLYMNRLTINDCSMKPSYPLYRQFLWGRRPPFEGMPIDKRFKSRNASWTVIDTPGHSKDHLAFLNEESGQLFSGDLYVHYKTKVALIEENIPTIIHSIEKVLTYNFSELFCCHAGYIKNGREALTNKLHYLKELQEHILSLHKNGYNEQEIKTLIFKKNYPISLFSFGEWDSIHIIRSILN